MMRTSRSRAGTGAGLRIIVGLVVAAFAIFSYLSSQEFNPVTGENQYLSLTPAQEIALGLQAQPELIQEFGGLVNDSEAQQLVDRVGFNLVNSSIAADYPWEYEFSVLDDPETINAFALPGGPMFITTALLSRFETEDQLAGVLAHEIMHILARHTAQRIAQNDLTNGLIGAVSVASGDANAAQTAAMIAQIVNMSYGREDEIQSDTLGVCLMLEAGYDPNAMIDVMRILAEAGGGGGQPEFFSTHPNPENRIARIEEAIAGAPGNCPSS